MGNLGDRYLWRPEPRGPIYVRFSFRLPGDSKLHRFVKSAIRGATLPDRPAPSRIPGSAAAFDRYIKKA